MNSNTYLGARRILDVFVSALLLLLFSPILLVVSTVILFRMGTPVFFRQTRVGHRGPFRLIKFRTMINGAEKLGGGYMPPELNLVPRVGAFLRKSSLDELPQLVNILRGEMSFIGPRPALPDQVDRYTPTQRARLSVPQGITGLAQVKYRNEAPWSVRIEADLEYIRTLGLRRDVLVLMATFTKVLAGSGVRADQSAADVDDLGTRK